jgi:hypothetical protein
MNKFIGFVLVVTIGCSSGTDPAQPGAADVNITVLSLSGQALVGATVGIRCADGAITKQVITDNLGQAGTPLDAPAAVMKDGSTIECVFGVPNVDNVKFRAVRNVAFGAIGVPHPIHFLTIQETQ